MKMLDLSSFMVTPNLKRGDNVTLHLFSATKKAAPKMEAAGNTVGRKSAYLLGAFIICAGFFESTAASPFFIFSCMSENILN